MLSLTKLAIATLFGTLFSASLWSAPRIPEEVKDHGLIYCTQDSAFSFNPQTVEAGVSTNVVAEQIYNKLFRLRDHSAKVEPELAKSYHLSADGKHLTINLRQGVKFHQTDWFTPTREFNAEDVVFSLNRVLGKNLDLPALDNAPAIANPQYQIFNQLAKKAQFPYFDSVNFKGKIAKVSALSPYQVRIDLFQPDASILSHLASQYAAIFSQEYALQLSADNNLAQFDLLPVGTGAYKVKAYARNQYVRLVRNEDYWQSKAKIANVVVDMSTYRTGRLTKLLNGECQLVAFPEVSQLGLFREGRFLEQFYVSQYEGMNLAFLAFNFDKAQMRDEQLRQAIAQAIDRQRLIDHIYYGTATIAQQIIPNVSWARSQSRFKLAYAPKQARDWLAPRHIELTLWVVNEDQVYNPSPMKMAEMIKFDLAQAGVTVHIRQVTRNYLAQQLKNKRSDYDLILTGWLASPADPDTFLRPILSCATQADITNLANWCNPAFDQAINRALTTHNLSLRMQDYQQAEQLIFQQLPIIPLASVKQVFVADKRVQGMEKWHFANIQFAQLSLKPQQSALQKPNMPQKPNAPQQGSPQEAKP